MNDTWQRIIKAGKGILEIARERNNEGYRRINDYAYVVDRDYTVLDDDAYYAKVTYVWHPKIEVDVEALNHLEEIAQAFEEALEIWRKM